MGVRRSSAAAGIAVAALVVAAVAVVAVAVVHHLALAPVTPVGDVARPTTQMPVARDQAVLDRVSVAAADLGPGARAVLGQLAAVYLDRLPAGLAAREASRIGADLHFAWEGPLTPGARHYYRVQGDDLLIEYDTTDDGNHAHTVLRRPRSDFGDDVLAAHYGQAHP